MRKSKSNRKSSWVMLTESGGYTPLPGEQSLYVSPPRTTLSLQSSNRNPPSQAYSVQCKSGVVHLTNRRIVYLPVSPTPEFQSFAVPILNVQDSRVTAPWFGANKWEAVIQPVYGGGIPAQFAELEVTMEFKEGGAFDFSTTFERLRERLRQAFDVARESGLTSGDGAELGGGRGGGALSGVNLNSVHLEDLPAYEDTRGQNSTGRADALSSPPPPRDSVVAPSSPPRDEKSSTARSPQQETFEPPSEPPPGYEEVQRESVADELERRLRDADGNDRR
ncbi:hypothetical protein BU24DRAFT_403738 [Aaosphaeria arxii CBS 175.79]|uniref:WW-domain-binding protein n=1 Tax=Aaosphaeria arxii CBS 175.79 TaxID=1450172 RepID=A0A6A5Y4Y5_9PLEO|nr:uncharacterized protein BU24DRAFT_403738 [Aaosphaeria arxii CBS 175.79]KAF2020645.1 hypothetical protein BU24DRAFT_403738 [Aaosphaeria arxii CBS 175.79]